MSFPPQQQQGQDQRGALFSQLFGQGNGNSQSAFPSLAGSLQPEQSLFLGDDEQDALALLLSQFLAGGDRGFQAGGDRGFQAGGDRGFQDPNQQGLEQIMNLFRQNQNQNFSLQGLGQQQGGLR